MNKGLPLVVTMVATVVLTLASAAVLAQHQRPGAERDVFKGKLFPPNVILEHQDALGLSKEQFTDIRAAVVEVQANVAEHEWDLRTAYQAVLTELDNSPIDSDKVMELVSDALQAENEVKKLQVGMLIKITNLLTDDQMDYLREINGN